MQGIEYRKNGRQVSIHLSKLSNVYIEYLRKRYAVLETLHINLPDTYTCIHLQKKMIKLHRVQLVYNM